MSLSFSYWNITGPNCLRLGYASVDVLVIFAFDVGCGFSGLY